MDPLSLVASTIAIVQATSSTYKSIQHIRGLPKEFNEVSRSLPLAEDTLLLLRRRLEDEAGDESANRIIRPFVNECEAKARKLQNIFEKLETETKNKDGSVRKTYRTFLVSFGKGYRVETLMQSLLKDLRALATNQLFKGALQREVIQIKEAIEELSKVESSVPDSDLDSSGTYLNQSIASSGTGYISHYSGQGQYVNAGSGQQAHYSGQNQHINVGGGKQFNAQTMNFEVQTDEDHQRRSAILKSLYTLPYLDRKNRNPDRSPGTCEWFVNHSQFKQWRASQSSSMLWVSANPGCGKSVLAKFLVDELGTSESRMVCYFFFKDEFDDQKSAIGALGCILHQLFIQREELFSNKILKRLEACKAQLGNSFDDLWDALLMAAGDRNAREIVCILDAFDECEEEERRKLGQTLRKFYDTGNNVKNDINLKFLITSRPYDKIGQGFQPLDIPGLPIIHLKGESDEEMSKIAKEIDLYIKDKVSRIRESRLLTPAEEQLLLQELRRIPNQTYLWVYLTLELLEGDLELDRTRIREIVSSLPPTIDDVYENILNKSSDFEKSKKLLHIIVAASRPLTVIEVDFALSLRPEHKSCKDWNQRTEERCSRYIRGLCGLFINIIESKVYLLHQTAKEFLVQEEGPRSQKYHNDQLQWKASLIPAESHRILFQICIWHLLFSEFEKYPRPRSLVYDAPYYIEHHIFLHYSATNWATHFRESDIDHYASIKSLRQLCVVYDNGSYRVWFGIYWFIKHGGIPRCFTPLMIASYFGLTPLVQFLLKEKDVIFHNKNADDCRSALSWAAENGFDDIVKLLTEGLPFFIRWRVKRAMVNDPDIYGRTPLMYAAWNGHIVIVRRLVKAGARTNIKDEISGTPISYARCAGHEDVAKELVKGTQVGSAEEIRDILFLNALSVRNNTTTKRLLEDGADVNAKDKNGRTPLMLALLRRRSRRFVKLLLDKGADPNARDNNGRSVVSLAWNLGYLQKTLLRNGADPNGDPSIDDSRYVRPLIMAIKEKDATLVKLLLDKGANPNVRDQSGRTALSYAYKHIPIFELLLDRGADPNGDIHPRELSDDRPLIVAIKQKDDTLVRLLLDKGADPNVKDKHGRTVLSHARGNNTMLYILVNAGAHYQFNS